MFDQNIFIDNHVTILFTLIMLSLLLFLFFTTRKLSKKNLILSKNISKIIGRQVNPLKVFKNGDECYFVCIFNATKIRYYVCFVAYIEALQDFVFCGVCNTKIWVTGDDVGFNPKLGKIYNIIVDGDVITLQEKGVRH